jgi:hypothetical protein
MLGSSIIVAVLLFTVAVFVLVDVFRPMLILHLSGSSPGTQDQDGQPLDESEIEETNAAFGRFVSGLSEGDREGFRLLWVSIRDEFHADPTIGLLHADLLMSDLIQDYRSSLNNPADLLAEGELKMDYRRAHEIALRCKQERLQQVELERAIGLYTALFEEFLGETTPSTRHRRAA